MQFINSLRQKMKRAGHLDKLRYYQICEYGGKRTRRCHWHTLLWGCPLSKNEIAQSWAKGRVDVGEIEPASIQYVSGYTWKRQDAHVIKHGLNPERAFMSKGSKKSGFKGIGYNYVEKNGWKHIQDMSDVIRTRGADGKVYLHKMDQYLKNCIWPRKTEYVDFETGELWTKNGHLTNEESAYNDYLLTQIRTNTYKEMEESRLQKLEELAKREGIPLEGTYEQFGNLHILERELIARNHARAVTNRKRKEMASTSI